MKLPAEPRAGDSLAAVIRPVSTHENRRPTGALHDHRVAVRDPVAELSQFLSHGGR